MKTIRDACQFDPNALSIELSEQAEQLDELIGEEGQRQITGSRVVAEQQVCTEACCVSPGTLPVQLRD